MVQRAHPTGTNVLVLHDWSGQIAGSCDTPASPIKGPRLFQLKDLWRESPRRGLDNR